MMIARPKARVGFRFLESWDLKLGLGIEGELGC